MSSRKGVRNCNLTSNRSCQVNVMEYKVMWSVSSLRHVAGTVAGCCPLVSAVLSDSLRAAAGSCSAPPGVSAGTNPPPAPSSARCLWPVNAPRPSGRSDGESVPQMSPLPPSDSSSYAFTPRSFREDLPAFSAQLVWSEFTWEPEQLLGFNMASSDTGDREEQVSGPKRLRSSEPGLICWFLLVLSCWESVRYTNPEERVCF